MVEQKTLCSWCGVFRNASIIVKIFNLFFSIIFWKLEITRCILKKKSTESLGQTCAVHGGAHKSGDTQFGAEE